MDTEIDIYEFFHFPKTAYFSDNHDSNIRTETYTLWNYIFYLCTSFPTTCRGQIFQHNVTLTPFFVIFKHKFRTFIKHKSTYYIYKVKCLIEVYINFTSYFDRGHGPLCALIS